MMASFRSVAGVLIALLATLLSAPAVHSQVSQASVEELVASLAGSDLDVRRDAAYELNRRGEYTPAVISAFIEGVEDRDAQIRFQSLLGLARAGAAAEPAIDALIECLEDRDDQVRYRAADALGKIGVAALPKLTELLSHDSSQVRIGAARALGILGPAAQESIGELVAALAHESTDVTRACGQALVSIVPDRESEILQVAQHAHPQVRVIGISALAHVRAPSQAVVAQLQTAAADDDPKVREVAVLALAKSNLPESQKRDLIESAVLDEQQSVQAAAIVAMHKAGIADAALAKRLAGRLESVDGAKAQSIAATLASIGPPAVGSFAMVLAATQQGKLDHAAAAKAASSFGAEVVRPLLDALQPFPELEPMVAASLAGIGQPAMDALVGAMSSQSEVVRSAATRGLAGIRPFDRKVLEILQNALDDADPVVRSVAASGLVEAGEQAAFAKEALYAATADESSSVRSAALPALAAIDFPAAERRIALETALADPSSDVRLSGLQTICQLDDKLRSYKPQVLALKQDPDLEVRLQVLRGLGKLEEDAIDEEVERTLLTAIENGERDVRLAATESVAALGIASTDILNALAGNLGDDGELLDVTLQALRGFGGKAQSLAGTILHLLSHQRATTRTAAVETLAAIEEEDKAHLASVLQGVLDDSEWEVRRVAAEALAELGPDAKEAVPKLFRMLSVEEDSDIASAALREINAAPVEAIPLLLASLGSEDRRAGFYAISLLGKIGPPAAEALPKLEAMLGEYSDGDRRSEFRMRFLREAIASIKGEESPDDEDR